jgi:glucuronate isomerase
MGKQSRIKAERRARRLIEQQLKEVDKVLKESEATLKNMEASKAEMLADLLTENANPNWRTQSLGDILNADQIQAVIDILNRTDVDDIGQTKLIKKYLSQFSKQLEAVGVLPDYLAYVLIANAPNLRAMAKASNNKPDDPFTPPPNAQN